MNNKICIASSNAGKLLEIKEVFNDFGFDIYSQADFNIKPAEETGTTFVENAIIKARHASHISKLPTIADDSGLCIEVLNQAPGVYSSSYAGELATPQENIQKIISSIEGYKDTPVKARIVTAICFMRNAADSTPLLIVESLDGEVLHQARGLTRGYDSIFFLPKLGKSIGELSVYEKNQISPRSRAIERLKPYLRSFYK